MSSDIFKCTPYKNLDSFSSNDYRNQVAREVMLAASIPVLRTSVASASQHDAHLEELDFRGHQHTDCTHFCSNAALFSHWSTLLYNALPALFSHSKGSISSLIPQSTVAVPEASQTAQKNGDEKPAYVLPAAMISLFENVTKNFEVQNKINTVKYGNLTKEGKLSGIYLTTGKDLPVFKKSIESALAHLVDVHVFFVICPKAQDLSNALAPVLGNLASRVVFIDEVSFPLTHDVVADLILETVKQVGLYPLNNGQSLFEKFLWSKLGWFYQQVVKLYSGEYLGIGNFVLLDSDIIWFKDIQFLVPESEKYNYAYSTQWHASYRSTLKTILGLDHTPGAYYSGICHHMVVLKKVKN